MGGLYQQPAQQAPPAAVQHTLSVALHCTAHSTMTHVQVTKSSKQQWYFEHAATSALSKPSKALC
jgi:hypothetical protein